MSKLEDKLTASINPGKVAPTPARRPKKTAEKPVESRQTAEVPNPVPKPVPVPNPVPKPVPKPASATPTPSEPSRFPHPRRVWPD